MDNIIKNLQEGFYTSNTAGQAAEALSYLTGHYAHTCNQLQEVLADKPSFWLLQREKVKSDTAAERAWENSPKGNQERILKYNLKATGQMIGTLRGIIKIAHEELLNTR